MTFATSDSWPRATPGQKCLNNVAAMGRTLLERSCLNKVAAAIRTFGPAAPKKCYATVSGSVSVSFMFLWLFLVLYMCLLLFLFKIMSPVSLCVCVCFCCALLIPQQWMRMGSKLVRYALKPAPPAEPRASRFEVRASRFAPRASILAPRAHQDSRPRASRFGAPRAYICAPRVKI